MSELRYRAAPPNVHSPRRPVDNPPSPSPHTPFAYESATNMTRRPPKATLWMILFGLLIVMPWIPYAYHKIQARQWSTKLNALQQRSVSLHRQLAQQSVTLQSIRTDRASVAQRNDGLLKELKEQQYGDNFDEFDAPFYNSHSELEEALLERLTLLRGAVSRVSQRELALQGRLLGRLSLLLVLELSLGKIVVALHPVSLYPHSVQRLLEWTETHSLYNRCSLIVRHQKVYVVNMDENLAATPLLLDDATAPKLKQPWRNTVVIHEQNEDYPVQQFSVLWNDKGPLFYIPLARQPTANHPHETSFGKVLEEGQEVLLKMATQSTQLYPIVSATIVQQES